MEKPMKKETKIFLSAEARNRILSRFRELGSILIELKVGDRVNNGVKSSLCLRRKGIKVDVAFLCDKVKFYIENSGLKQTRAFEFATDVNVSEEFIDKLHYEYEGLLETLRNEQWYTERVDPTHAQVSAPEVYSKAMEMLKPSLVFTMSKGSHELFHSNIWAWLIEKDSRFARAFFPEIKGEIESVKREEGNRDLTIWTRVDGRRRAYVVENKFKSIPRREQLEEYDEKIGGDLEEGLLVALQIPEDFRVGEWRLCKWRLCTQNEILDGIAQVLYNEDVAMTQVEKSMLDEYIKMTQILAGVLRGFTESLRWRWPLAGTVAMLEDIKLGDIFQKFKAAEFVGYVNSQLRVKVDGTLDSTKMVDEWRKRIEELPKYTSPTRRLRFENSQGFSNKQALVDFRIVMQQFDDGEWQDRAGIGIQLQGDAYNRCVYSFDKKKTARWLDDHFKCNWLEDAEFLDQSLRLNRSICGYCTKEYTFRYRGVALTSDSFADIFKQMSKDMKKMLLLLDSGSLDELFAVDIADGRGAELGQIVLEHRAEQGVK